MWWYRTLAEGLGSGLASLLLPYFYVSIREPLPLAFCIEIESPTISGDEPMSIFITNQPACHFGTIGKGDFLKTWIGGDGGY